MRYITTSWDDGHPMDLQLAALLEKYNLKGTFYIPKTNGPFKVMSVDDILDVSCKFEIGGHTLSHIDLTKCDLATVFNEVKGCYNWLQVLLDKNPISFCLPFGKYTDDILPIVYNSGYKFIRTAKLLNHEVQENLNHPTIQIFQHSRFTLMKHLIHDKRMNDLIFWICNRCETNLLKLVDIYIEDIIRYGGCLHIWGHSWEIEKYGKWKILELIFSKISNCSEFTYVENRELIQ